MKTTTIIKTVVASLLGAAICVQSYKAFTYQYGPGGGYANAPSESNCTSCHSGTLGNPGTDLTISNGQSTFDYIPDSTYAITIKYANSSIKTSGFEVTALLASNNSMAGTFSTLNSTTQTTSATIGTSLRYYVEHTSSGTYFSSGNPNWSFKWKAPSANLGNITFYVVVNAANGDGSDYGDKIYAETFTMKPSSKLPTASFTYSPNPVCLGDSVKFSGSSTGNPTSYSWTFAGANISSSSVQNPKVYFKGAGAKAVTLTTINSYGKSLTVTKQVFVYSLPKDTVGISGPTTFCKGGSVLLTATPGTAYAWSTGDSTQSILVKDSGNYFVTVINSGGCATTSKTVSVHLLPVPIAVLTSNAVNDSLCSGDDLVLTADTGGSKYVFYQNGKLYSSATSHTAVISNVSGINNKFYVIVYNANGCSDTSATLKVAVRSKLPSPLVTQSKATTSSVTINWSQVNGAKGYEVSEDSGKTWEVPSSGPLGQTHTMDGLNYSQSIKLQVRALSYSGSCPQGNIGSEVATTLSCSGITYNVLSDTLICAGDTGHISINNISTPHYGISLNGGAATRATRWSVVSAKDTTLNLKMYDSTSLNCPPIDLNIKIKVKALPQVAFNSHPAMMCEGQSFDLGSTAGYARYVYYLDGKPVQDGSGNIYTYKAGTGHHDMDTLGVQAYNSNGCQGPLQNIVIGVNPSPHAGFTYQADKLNLSFSDTSRNGSSRTWYFGDNTSDTAASISHSYAYEGNYTVSLVSRNTYGCTDSISKTVHVSETGIAGASLMQDMRIQPNPFNQQLNVRFNALGTGTLHVQLLDMLGRPVLPAIDIRALQGFNEFNISTAALPDGAYILYLSDGSTLKTERLIKLSGR